MYQQVVPNDCGLALKWGAGFQYLVTKHIALFLEVAYRYGDTGKSQRQGYYELDVYAWSYGGGVKFYF